MPSCEEMYREAAAKYSDAMTWESISLGTRFALIDMLFRARMQGVGAVDLGPVGTGPQPKPVQPGEAGLEVRRV